MTVFASAAEAWVSCDHVSVVVRGFATSDSAKRDKKKSVYRSTKKRNTRAIKARNVKPKSTAKKVETARTAPIKSETANENSTNSTAWSLGNSYVGCKTLSIGCVVANSEPTKMTGNLGRLSVPEPNQLASGRRESPTLKRGAFGNTEH